MSILVLYNPSGSKENEFFQDFFAPKVHKKAEPETGPAFWIIWRLGLSTMTLGSPAL